MTVHQLSLQPSILDVFLTALRDKHLQLDAARFRRNLERIGEVIAYEVSKTLVYQKKKIQTPLAETEVFVPANPIVVSSILRAGLPLHQGILNYFDTAASTLITSFTSHKEAAAVYQEPYISKTNIDNAVLILADPMLATGTSLVAAHKALLKLCKKDMPKALHIAVVVASPEGLARVQREIQADNVHLWVLAVDEYLNDKGYIVPGLGDAGDLAFGSME